MTSCGYYLEALSTWLLYSYQDVADNSQRLARQLLSHTRYSLDRVYRVTLAHVLECINILVIHLCSQAHPEPSTSILK
jgi:hypothetical protein